MNNSCEELKALQVKLDATVNACNMWKESTHHWAKKHQEEKLRGDGLAAERDKLLAKVNSESGRANRLAASKVDYERLYRNAASDAAKNFVMYSDMLKERNDAVADRDRLLADRNEYRQLSSDRSQDVSELKDELLTANAKIEMATKDRDHYRGLYLEYDRNFQDARDECDKYREELKQSREYYMNVVDERDKAVKSVSFWKENSNAWEANYINAANMADELRRKEGYLLDPNIVENLKAELKRVQSVSDVWSRNAIKYQRELEVLKNQHATQKKNILSFCDENARLIRKVESVEFERDEMVRKLREVFKPKDI